MNELHQPPTKSLRQNQHTYLPLGVLMRQQLPLVRAGHHHEAAVLPMYVLHGRPRAHDAVGRGKGEVVKICDLGGGQMEEDKQTDRQTMRTREEWREAD